MIKLFNSLSKEKEVFTPINESKIGMYVCGPTVYSRAHIGNARAVVVFDLLSRVLRQEYGEDKVIYVRNITDVDDKINNAAKERDISIKELTAETTKMFHDDMEQLNCIKPDIEPRATEHISEMIQMCEILIDRGHAYVANNHVLFDVTSYKNYGHLSRRSPDEMVAGSRVEIASFKKNPADFVLWKPSNDDEPSWESPWGKGRPGWHIECSVMSTKYLSQTFDIHGGGADLQFPHHENEIAQSCCAYPESEYAKYWIHNGFLTVDGEKMSKSLGNFITVNDILSKHPDNGLAVRYALLATHYRKPLDWSEKARIDANKAIDKFTSIIIENKDKIDKSIDIPAEFLSNLSDDLNTPKAIAKIHEFAKTNDYNNLYKSCELLGIISQKHLENFSNDNKVVDISNSEIEELISKRKEARLAKNWQESDRIRDLLKEKNITLKDNPDGTTSWNL